MRQRAVLCFVIPFLLMPAGSRAQSGAPPAAAQPSIAHPAPPASRWPAVDGTVTLPDFHFGSGESLPALGLNYLTLGTPHRNAAGHVDNAVLLLHGTGGERHTLLNPIFSNVLFGPGQPLDITKYFL